MQQKLILTLTGHDQIGIVEKVTGLVLKNGGNVEASRMARLGGEFAMLMLISVADRQLADLESGVQALNDEGFVVTTCETEQTDPSAFAGWMPYEIQVQGADHEGIVHHIAHHLSERGINVETMDTNTVMAPMSGTPLFEMTTVVLVPPSLAYSALEDELESIGDDLNVDVDISPYTG